MVRERSICRPEPVAKGRPESTGRMLALTAKAVREWFDAHLAAHGGSLPMWIVLTHAVDHDGSPSQRELAARMGIGGATLVRHLDRFERDGLVLRRRDEHDRRITRIDITPAGRQRLAELAVVAAEVDREVHSLMSDEEATVLRSVLQRLREHALHAPRPAILMHPSAPLTPDALTTDETDVA
jgi:MarR family transcriptional regulator, transcriptional regulator for hemolysin